MDEPILQRTSDGTNRRQFLGVLGQTAVAAAASQPGTVQAADKGPPVPGKVRQRVLGKTGLKVSEIGFGGHSWSFKRVPDGNGVREVTLAEAERMIRLGLEMGVNFFDSCTAPREHTVPGEIIKRLGKRDEVLVSARCCHKMKCILPGGVDWRFSFPPIRSLAMTRSEQSAERERFWRSMVDQQRQAGQTVRAFCREKEISEPSFYAWRRTLKRRAAGPSPDATSGTRRADAGRVKGAASRGGVTAKRRRTKRSLAVNSTIFSPTAGSSPIPTASGRSTSSAAPIAARRTGRVAAAGLRRRARKPRVQSAKSWIAAFGRRQCLAQRPR